MTEDKLKPGAVVADRYRLERPLGIGGMGAVWLAHNIGLDMPCAVKLLRAEAAGSADMRARFEREAKAAARLKSAHVVQILDHGVWDGVPYIAMEYLEGEDLHRRIKRLRRLDPRETMRIVSQVARALARAHVVGLVHRDLKPSNVFLSREEDQEIAKVLDFGVAKLNVAAQSVSEQETKTGSLLGTPHYMSPEQAQGTREVDHRSDLWSLAVVTFQCLTGQLPFKSDALGDLLVQIIVKPPPVPSKVAAHVPPAFDAWWAKATAREPEQRFQTARDFTVALASSLGVPLDARWQEGGDGQSVLLTPSSLAMAVAPTSVPMPLPTPLPLPTPHDPGPVTPGPMPSLGPPSSSGNSAAPTANLGVQSISIARPPEKRRGRIVLVAIGVGVFVGGLAAALAPHGDSSPASTSASASEAAAPATLGAAPVDSAAAGHDPAAPSSEAAVAAAPPSQTAITPPSASASASAAAPSKKPEKPSTSAPAKGHAKRRPDFGI